MNVGLFQCQRTRFSLSSFHFGRAGDVGLLCRCCHSLLPRWWPIFSVFKFLISPTGMTTGRCLNQGFGIGSSFSFLFSFLFPLHTNKLVEMIQLRSALPILSLSRVKRWCLQSDDLFYSRMIESPKTDSFNFLFSLSQSNHYNGGKLMRKWERERNASCKKETVEITRFEMSSSIRQPVDKSGGGGGGGLEIDRISILFFLIFRKRDWSRRKRDDINLNRRDAGASFIVVTHRVA